MDRWMDGWMETHHVLGERHGAGKRNLQSSKQPPEEGIIILILH